MSSSVLHANDDKTHLAYSRDLISFSFIPKNICKKKKFMNVSKTFLF